MSATRFQDQPTTLSMDCSRVIILIILHIVLGERHTLQNGLQKAVEEKKSFFWHNRQLQNQKGGKHQDQECMSSTECVH